MENLGERIRKLRRLQSLTLKQLSARTNLSVSFLSEFERDLAQPSLGSLRKIAKALGVSAVSLAPRNEAGSNGTAPIPRREGGENRSQYIKDVRVVRAGNRKKIAYPGIDHSYELLTPNMNRQLEVLYSRTKGGFDSGEPIMDPPGEKFILVLKGSYELTVAGETYHLEEGDSMSYPADAPVSWRVPGSKDVEVVLVITPPGF